jgi:uncharacterized protein
MTHPIPEAALANHIAILGKTGSGKSWTARSAVEGILDRGGRACIIDPTSAWWGLKSSATGKSGGYPVVIFGGEHADLPLAGSHGEALAEIIGTSSTPAILDVSLMRVGERTRFFADFADALVRKNKGPLHLVIDEAHLFAPQGKVNDPQSGAMLHAANNLVSLGRSKGLRIILITQRPAKLHKDSLTQVETLVAMRLIAPQDRKAVEEWVKDNADPEKGREIITSMATLKTGHGWIWAPELQLLERVQFPRIRTFDSSRAPEDIADTKVVLAPIDRDAIASRLQAVAADAVANDPVALKRRVAELERQVRTKPTATPEALQEAEQRGYESGLNAGRRESEQERRALHTAARAAIDEAFQRAPAALSAPAAPAPRPVTRPPPTRVISNGSTDESPSVRKILDVIHRSYPVSLSFDAAARRAAISSRSSAYRSYRAAVAASSELEESDGKYRSRPEFASTSPVSSLTSIEEWVAKLPPAYGKMLRAIHENGPLDKDSVADLAGVSRTSSGLGTGLRELQSLQLIAERDGRYEVEEGL